MDTARAAAKLREGAHMDAFSFVFSLFGLLLGLSLTEVLGGFVRALKARRRIRLGYLTPLLGIFMMLDITSFWMDAWKLRDVIPATNRSLVVGVIITSIYFFAASLVFPDDPEREADFDDYFFRHKKQVLGAILVADTIDGVLTKTLRDHDVSGRDLASSLVVLAILSAAIFAKGRKTNIVILSLIIASGMLVAIS